MVAIRRFGVVVGLAVSIVGLGACASSGKRASTTTTSGAPTTSTQKAGRRFEPRFIAAAAPVNTVVLRGGLLLLAPPAVSHAPKVTAVMAFNECGENARAEFRMVPPLIPPTVELTRVTLKDYGQAHGNGSVTPFISRRLVWIIWYKSQTIDFESNKGSQGPAGVTAATPTTLRFKEGIMTFVDAQTGRCLNTQGFPP